MDIVRTTIDPKIKFDQKKKPKEITEEDIKSLMKTLLEGGG